MRIVPMVLAVITACAPDQIPGPPAGFTQATATRECGPTDGPAVGFTLTADSGRYVQITVWQSLDRLGDQSWGVGNEPGAVAWFYSGASDPQPASDGRVTVTAVDTTSTIQGSVDLTFPTVGRVRGGFRAAWIPRTLLCG